MKKIVILLVVTGIFWLIFGAEYRKGDVVVACIEHSKDTLPCYEGRLVRVFHNGILLETDNDIIFLDNRYEVTKLN